MQYISTRGQANPQSFQEVLLEGLAPDQGLYLPEEYPAVTEQDLANWQHLSYAELATQILQRFISDIPVEALASLVQEVYSTANFRAPEITPVHQLDHSLYLLRLSEGPSLAFKDIALQWLAKALQYTLEQTGRTVNIVGATSGDTGSAAEYALCDKSNVQVFMLSPYGKMSAFQQAQMYSLRASHVHNLAIRGVFDDCQNLVKALQADRDWKARYCLSTVNSINWARIAAQVVYYFYAYLALQRQQKTTIDKVSFSIPSGNFGNAYAGYVAKRMGLPIEQLIVATNENKVLADFLSMGIYRIRTVDEVVATSSPSMDIAKASNLERLVYDAVQGNPTLVQQMYAQLEAGQSWDWRLKPYQQYHQHIQAWGFSGVSVLHQERLETIRQVWSRYGCVVDPHTANGIAAAWQHQSAATAASKHPVICLETAAAAKFADTMHEALGQEPPRPSEFIGLEQRPQFFQNMEPDLNTVKAYIEQHALVI